MKLRLAAACAFALALITVVPVLERPTFADGSPDITLSRSVATNTLYGANAAVTLTATNSAGPDGFNLSFRDVLPPGTSLATSDPAPTKVLPQPDGTTVVIWQNVADLLTGVSFSVTYELDYDTTADPGTPTYRIGDTLAGSAGAYVNSNPRLLPRFLPTTGAPIAVSSTGSDTATSQTSLAPFLVHKSEPSPESELLRGVHDHQTVYTIEIENNLVTPTTDISLVDHLPAGLEYLGCTVVDNSTPGTEEYSGSGPITNAHTAFANPCVVPTSATTVTADPDGTDPLPAGVYTRLDWTDLLASLAPGAVYRMDYAAAIPLHENVAFTGDPTANLDNNTGALTADEQQLTNHVAATGTAAGGTYTVDDTAQVTAEDVALQKTTPDAGIDQGQTSTWTMRVESSEYATSTGPITVTDVIPNGLAFTSAAPAPSSGPTNNADGTQTVVWVLTPFTVPSSTDVITLRTTTLSEYRPPLGGPVSANDSWSNSATLRTTAAIITADDGTTTALPIPDDSSADQSARGITLSKQVSAPQSPMTCGNGSTISWQQDQAGDFHPGDRVCWLLSVVFPDDLDTRTPQLRDLLPDGFTYVGQQYTPANDVPPGDVTFTDNGGLLEWNLSNVDEGELFQVVVETKITGPELLDDTAGAPDLVENLLKLRYTNTAGQPFQLRDSANVSYVEATLALDKTIVSLNGAPFGPAATITASGGDTVGFRVAVGNTSDLATTTASVRDLLPAGIDCAQVSAISGGGTCTAATPSFLQWTLGGLAAGATTAVTYSVTFDPTEVPGTVYTNHAGIRDYQSATNEPGAFTYVPQNNIDPTAHPQATWNAPPADDTAEVRITTPAIDKTSTSPVLNGNSAAQATIGEVISYSVAVTIPEGLRLTGPATLTDVLPTGLQIVAGSPTFTINAAAGPAPTVSGNTITVTLANPYENTVGDDSLLLTYRAVVADAAANTRGRALTNTATLRYADAAGVTTSLQDTATTTVVTPVITLAKDENDADDVVAPGQQVQYTLTVTNANAGTVAAAYDTVVVDTVPIDLVPLSGGAPATTGQVVDGGGNGVWDATARTITFTVATINRNASVALRYDARVADPLFTGGTIHNSAVARTTSISGTATGERNGTSGPGAVAGSGFVGSASDDVHAPQLSLTKVVLPGAQTIGERVTYTVDVRVPAGVVAYDATVIDVVPAGIVDVTLDDVTCTADGGAACDPDVTSASVALTGQTYSFFIDDLAPADDDARTIRLTYSGRVAQTLATGNTPNNSATIHANDSDRIHTPPTTPPNPSDFDFSSAPSTATVTIVEPHLTIDKDVRGQVGDSDTRRAEPGDVLTFDVTVANIGSSTAYGVDVTDTPDPRLVDFVPLGSNPAGATVVDATPSDGTLAWNVASIPAGSSVTISYSLRVPPTLGPSDEVVAGPELTNTADATYLGVLPATFDPSIHKSYDDVTPDTVDVELDLAVIGDRVWNDVDGDGVQDAGEPGLGGLTVTVVYLGPNGVAGGGDDETSTTTTAADGTWSVPNLPGGAYVVSVTPPAGYAPTFDLDGTGTPSRAAATLTEGQVRSDVDFGYRGTGSIGDRVWWDADGDGVQDASETGLAGVSVTVTWGGPDGDVSTTADNQTFTTVTGADGIYTVGNLAPGAYVVALDPATLPAGFVPTYDLIGPLDHTATVSLSPGGTVTNVDFGYRGTGSIGDLVWLDRNGDGTVDADEPGIAGVTVELTWYGRDGLPGGGDDVVLTTTTDADGTYTFADLPAGNFTVAVLGTLPAGVTNSHDEDGDHDSRTNVTLAVGEHHETADFGYAATALLGDRVWWDLDRDGVQDTGEPGIPGVEITVVYAGPDGDLATDADNLVFVTTTGADGAWTVADVPLGNYRVTITAGLPTGMDPTFDADGIGTPNESLTTLTATAPIDVTQDFGYAGTGSLGDRVWFDRDGDGAQDADEPGLPGVDVVVTWFGPDGIAGTSDDLTVTVTTALDGTWSVPGLPAGSYSVTVDPTTLPADVVATFDADGTPNGTTTVALADGEARDDLDFGYRGQSSIGDAIVWDRDADGTVGDRDVGIAGVTVTLDWAGVDGVWGTADDATFTTTTAGDGSYLFAGLPAGPYVVTVDAATLPPGMAATFDEDGGLDSTTAVDLVVATDHLTADFGYTGAGSIGDTVWLDLDGDGVQGPGEPGIAGQRVDLVWVGPDGLLGTDDDVILTTTTAADGTYLFEQLPDGDFRVEVVGGIAGTAVNTGDPDGGDPSQSLVTLDGGVANLDQDFGYQGTGTIGDTIWWDVDADGIDDGAAAEPRLAGVNVVVTWLGVDGVASPDDIEFTTTTGADGTYRVNHLPAGNYTVRVLDGVPPSLVSSVDDDSLNGSGDASSGLTLGAGEVNLDQDFGYVAEGSIGDRVWLDVDADGVQDPGEPGLAGATVTLTYAGLDGVFGTADDLTFVTVTDAGGQYLFARLAAGGYRVVVSGTPVGYHVSADADGGLDGISTLTLTDGQSNLLQDFGYAGSAALHGVVYDDIDRDRVREPGEGGVAGVRVVVTWSGPDGPVVIVAVTAPDGSWSLPDLPPGGYTVTLDPTSLPAGFSSTTPSAVTVGLAVGQTGNVDFGVARPFGGNLPQTGTGDRLPETAGLLLLAGVAAVGIAWRRRRRAA